MKHRWSNVKGSKGVTNRYWCDVCGAFWTATKLTDELPAEGCKPPEVGETLDTDFESAGEASARLQALRDADPASEYRHRGLRGRERHAERFDVAERKPLGPRTVDFRPDFVVDEGPWVVPIRSGACACGATRLARRTVCFDALVRGVEMVEFRCATCGAIAARVLVYLKGGPWPWQHRCEQINRHLGQVIEGVFNAG